MVTRPVDEKLQAYRAAKEMLEQNNDDLLRYVALDLRRCIEAVVYEKLATYEKWIPVKVARTWQPPQAFKALLVIDPGAQDDAVIGVALQSRPDLPATEPPKMLGNDYRPRVKWLTDTWNKLGSYLHADWPFARASDSTGRREFMEKIVSELERFVKRSFTVAFANTTSFECSECGGTVVASELALRETGHATCLNCWLRYSVREEEGQPFFYLEEPHITCDQCQGRVFVPTVEIKVGYRLPCRNCGRVFEAVRENWVFQIDDSPAK